jgi:hypothetical protein
MWVRVPLIGVEAVETVEEIELLLSSLMASGESGSG